MRFVIEQRHLTDAAGKPVADVQSVAFFTCDADSVDGAVRSFAEVHGAVLIGKVLEFPGFQAVATMRNNAGVFTLQVGPSSQQLKLPLP